MELTRSQKSYFNTRIANVSNPLSPDKLITIIKLITFSGSIGSVAITADSEQQLVFITKTKAQKAFVELLKVSF